MSIINEDDVAVELGYDNMSIDALIDRHAERPAYILQRHLRKRKIIRDTYLDISGAMAEAGEIVVVDRNYRPFFIGSQLDEAAVEAAIDASEELTARANGKADGCEYVQTVLVAYREASLSLANEAGVKP